MPLCALSLAEVGHAFERILERAKLGEGALGLEVAYVGDIGPRCSPADPGCLPFPYLEPHDDEQRVRAGDFALPYDPDLPRSVVSRDGARSLGGACRTDGDCGPSGARHTCAAWHVAGPRGGSHVAYTTMYDDFCGCVNQQCAWFTPERPGMVLEARLRVEGWGEPKARDARRFEVGFGTGGEVVKARLENGWMRRQLQRCYLGHLDALPETLTLALSVDRDGKPISQQVAGADSRVRPCVEQVFAWLQFPSRRKNSFIKDEPPVAQVTGELSLRAD